MNNNDNYLNNQPNRNYPTYEDLQNNNNYNNSNNTNSNNLVERIINNQAGNIAENVVNKTSNNIKSGFLDSLTCSPSFLKEYFDIETEEIKERLLLSLNPLNSRLMELINKKPDLYGPFWIYTTLVFVIAASGSLTKYLNGHREKEYFQNFIPLSASVIYGIGVVLPLIIFLLMHFFNSDANFINILCMYAYSFFVFIPIMILCIPFENLQWPLLSYAILSSTIFLLNNFWREVSMFTNSRKYFILSVILIFQICLLFVLKLNFFKHISNKVIEE